LRLRGVRNQVTLRLDASRQCSQVVMLRNPDTRQATDRRAAVDAAAAHMDEVGVYLTDEVFLYRIVDVVVTGAGEMADIEDCFWLDVVRVPMGDVLARRLRVVTPS
jgi:hypothetical protein